MLTTYPCDGWMFTSGDCMEMPDALPWMEDGDLVCPQCFDKAYPDLVDEKHVVDKPLLGSWWAQARPDDGSHWWLCNTYGPICPESETPVECVVCGVIVREAYHIDAEDLGDHGLEQCECPDCVPERYKRGAESP